MSVVCECPAPAALVALSASVQMRALGRPAGLLRPLKHRLAYRSHACYRFSFLTYLTSQRCHLPCFPHTSPSDCKHAFSHSPEHFNVSADTRGTRAHCDRRQLLLNAHATSIQAFSTLTFSSRISLHQASNAPSPHNKNGQVGGEQQAQGGSLDPLDRWWYCRFCGSMYLSS